MQSATIITKCERAHSSSRLRHRHPRPSHHRPPYFHLLNWNYSYPTFLFMTTLPHPATIQLQRSNPWKGQTVRDQSVSWMFQRSGKVPRRIPHSTWYIVYPRFSIPQGVWHSAWRTTSKRNQTRNYITAKNEEDEHKMVQQPCLPPQAEREFEAPPEHQTSIQPFRLNIKLLPP